MKVLLVSPKDPETPGELKWLMGGENTYTKTLLDCPPKGVIYVHYDEAIGDGQITCGPWQVMTNWLIKLRILPLSAGLKHIVVRSQFDLIHCHVYQLKVSGNVCPILLSDSSSNFLTLKEYFGWSELRIRLSYFLRYWLFKWLKVIDGDLGLGTFQNLVVFSEFARRVRQQFGVKPQKVEVIYPGLPTPAKSAPKKNQNIRILFVGTWFERKGGLILLAAYKQLVKEFTNLELVVVGDVPKGINLTSYPRVRYHRWISRTYLYENIYPSADILVHVPARAEGYGFVVQEAMSFGIPCVVSRLGALPELVEDGETGWVIEPGSVDSLVLALRQLIGDGRLRQRLGEAAYQRFEKKFSLEPYHRRLLAAYQLSRQTHKHDVRI